MLTLFIITTGKVPVLWTKTTKIFYNKLRYFCWFVPCNIQPLGPTGLKKEENRKKREGFGDDSADLLEGIYIVVVCGIHHVAWWLVLMHELVSPSPS